VMIACLNSKVFSNMMTLDANLVLIGVLSFEATTHIQYKPSPILAYLY